MSYFGINSIIAFALLYFLASGMILSRILTETPLENNIKKFDLIQTEVIQLKVNIPNRVKKIVHEHKKQKYFKTKQIAKIQETDPVFVFKPAFIEKSEMWQVINLDDLQEPTYNAYSLLEQKPHISYQEIIN